MNDYVLLHGFTGSPASWDALVERLPAGSRVLRPALLGHGAAGPSADRFDAEVDRVATQVHAWRRPIASAAAGTENAHSHVSGGLAPGVSLHVVGYSLGARVALGLLVRHPGLFERATLVGVHPGLVDERERRVRLELDEGRARLLEQRGIEAFVDVWERAPLFATQRDLPKALRSARRRIRLGHDARGLARSLRVLGLGAMPSRASALAGLRVPIQLVAGARDPKFRALAEQMVAALPQARVCIVDGVGHDVALEDPETVAALIGGGP